MSLKAKPCVKVICDGGCDDPWEERTPHFDTVDDAVETVRSYGWVVVGNRALCPECATTEGCKLTGHQWPEDWTDSAQEGVEYRYRYCEHCTADEHEPPWSELLLLVRAARIVNGAAQDVP